MEKTQKLSLLDSIRKRPGMYFGEINSIAVNNIVYELVANSVDQYLSGQATKVRVEVHEDKVIVSDDGNGMPFDMGSPDNSCENLVEYYFLNRHDSPTADGHAPHIHIQGGGLGLAILNCASESVRIKSNNGTQQFTQRFGQGTSLEQLKTESSSAAAGTSVELVIDKELFNGYQAGLAEMRKTLFELAHFYPGLVVEFQDERFKSDRGLSDLAYLKAPFISSYNPEKPKPVFDISIIENGIGIQVGAIGTAETNSIVSWVNGRQTTEGGTHVDGLAAALHEASWIPQAVLIHVIMHKPEFAGPVKNKLVNTEVGKVIESALAEPLRALLGDQ